MRSQDAVIRVYDGTGNVIETHGHVGASSKSGDYPMNATEKNQWLAEHVPHRLRACLPFLTLQEELMPNAADEKARQKIRGCFLVTAALEGRMVALRWLIEFVGIRERKGKPDRPRLGNTGVSILCMEGGREIKIPSPEADMLAKVWKACSQASGHPTRDTNHLPLTNAVIDEALRIIVGHLKQSIYSADPDKLVALTLTPLRRTER
jgi:hypothetical protein